MELIYSSALTNMSQLLNGTNLPKCTCLPGCHWIGYNKVHSSSPLANSYKIKQMYLAGRNTVYFKSVYFSNYESFRLISTDELI